MTVTNFPSQNPRIGLHPGLDRATYESIPAINVSILAHFERSAAHAREEMLHPRKPSAEMDFGTALHCAILEPKRFGVQYAMVPKCDRRTTEGKRIWNQWEIEHPGAEPLKEEEWIAIARMRESVFAHPVAKQLLSGIGHNEVGVVAEDPETKLLLKSLIDRIGTYADWTWVVDLKSCQDASRRGFASVCKKLHYGAKAAYYLDNCKLVAPRDRRFAWVAVEKEPPYAVQVFEADDSAISAGRSKYSRWLRLYAEAQRTNIWPAYESEIEPLTSYETEWRSE